MGEAALMQLAEEKRKMAAFLSSARIEIPESAVSFSDPCPCCGNRKRRCLHPPSTPRKKRLLFHPTPADSPSSSSALTTPSSARSVGPASSTGSPASSCAISPLVPLRIPVDPTPTSASPPALPSSSSDHPGPTDEEVRVRVKCKCGVVREIVLVR